MSQPPPSISLALTDPASPPYITALLIELSNGHILTVSAADILEGSVGTYPSPFGPNADVVFRVRFRAHLSDLMPPADAPPHPHTRPEAARLIQK